MCVFNLNLCVFDSLSAIRHRRELTCRVTITFCAHFLDVCACNTVYQKFKLICFKMRDISAIDMIIKTNFFFFDRVSEV